MFKNVFWREDDTPPPKGDGKNENEEAETKEAELEEYNPFEHRNVLSPTSDYGALAHMLKTSLGSGILAMPMAFRHAGLLLGTLGTLLVGIVCTHCVQLLVWNSQRLCRIIRVPTLSFSKTAEVAFQVGPKRLRRFGRACGILITTELLASFILGNTVYVVFISHTMYQVAEFYWQPGVDIRLYTIILWIPLTLMCMMPNLKSLVPFSIVANIFVVFSFSITMYYIFRNIRPADSVYMVAPFTTWPLFLATVVFAVEGIGTVLPIENEMQHPEHFLGPKCGILYTAMTVVVFLYAFVGFFGFLEYGNETKGSVTLNLPINDVLAQSVKLLIAVAIFFTYALQFYVPVTIVLRAINRRLPERYHRVNYILVRVTMVAITMTISLVIPHLEPIISLVGAICFSMLGLLFPSVIDLVARYPDFGRAKWRLYKNVTIIIVSLIVLLAGAYASVMEIIFTYFDPDLL